MTEQSIAILPSRVTQVAAAMTSGTTLYNGDATAALWVSANPNPGPGTGFKIGPQGSVSWTTDGAPVYAVVDTGVTRTLTLTVSDNIGNPVDPVSVGAAVAAQLLTQGVPSVLVGKTLTPSNPGQYDVSGYASVSVNVTLLGPCLFTYYYTNEAGDSVYSRSFSVAAGVSTLQFTSAVAGPTLQITDGGSGMMSNRSVYASNREIGRASCRERV